MSKTRPTTLVPYFGGKSYRLAKNFIVPRFPRHKVYVVPYGGLAGDLWEKSPESSEIEVYNDKADGLVILLEVVRDPVLSQELIRKLRLTPYARQEWRRCMYLYTSGEWANLSDKVEKARIVYTLLAQSFTGTLTNGGWSFGGLKHNSNVATTFYRAIENIEWFSQRLRTVQIEHCEALDLMKRWDGIETLFYLDPPYLPETRSKRSKGRKQYEHELTRPEHEELLNFCLKSQSKILLSGYPSRLYDECLLPVGWVCETFAAYATSAMYSIGNGLKGRPVEAIKRTECLWLNPAAQETEVTVCGVPFKLG